MERSADRTNTRKHSTIGSASCFLALSFSYNFLSARCLRLGAKLGVRRIIYTASLPEYHLPTSLHGLRFSFLVHAMASRCLTCKATQEWIIRAATASARAANHMDQRLLHLCCSMSDEHRRGSLSDTSIDLVYVDAARTAIALSMQAKKKIRTPQGSSSLTVPSPSFLDQLPSV